jgi:hypothetical protein
MVRQPRETAEEKKARELREAYESVYENHDEAALKTRIVNLLDEIDDHAEQRQAHMDTMKDLIDDKKDELMYCRQRRQYVMSAQGRAELEEQATEIIEEAA